MKPPEPFSIQIPVAKPLNTQQPGDKMTLRSTLVGGVRISAHLENNVHDRRCLRDLPMDTGGSGSRGRLGKVDDEVADAPEEVVLVHVPLGAVAARDVRVRICVEGGRRQHTSVQTVRPVCITWDSRGMTPNAPEETESLSAWEVTLPEGRDHMSNCNTYR